MAVCLQGLALGSFIEAYFLFLALLHKLLKSKLEKRFLEQMETELFMTDHSFILINIMKELTTSPAEITKQSSQNAMWGGGTKATKT